jgi:hypothetical protein
MHDHDDEKATANYIGLSVGTLRKRRRLGLPPTFIKIGRRVIYARADADRLLAEQRVVPVGSGGSILESDGGDGR